MSSKIAQFSVFMSPEVDDFVYPVLRSGYITQGPMVEEFESQLKKYLGVESALTVNSGTSALMLALKLAGAGPGTNVISTPMTCSATNEAISLMGADIIWADVDKWGNIDPHDVLKKMNSRTAAVMAVDWGGLPCSYDELRAVLKLVEGQKKIPIIEDAAHGFGATYKNLPTAITGGDYVCYSFQAIKTLTCGDGGLVVCPDAESYERGKLLRWFGLDRTSSDAMRSRQDIAEVGYKFHMNDISASIGMANMVHVEDLLERQQAVARVYDEYLSEFRPEWPEDRQSSYWLYTINVTRPLDFETWMGEKGIVASQVHRRNDEYSCFSKYKSGTLPNLDTFSKTMCAIPSGWWLTDTDLDWIIDCVLEWGRRT